MGYRGGGVVHRGGDRGGGERGERTSNGQRLRQADKGGEEVTRAGGSADKDNGNTQTEAPRNGNVFDVRDGENGKRNDEVRGHRAYRQDTQRGGKTDADDTRRNMEREGEGYEGMVRTDR